MTSIFETKQQARQTVWDQLQAKNLAAFPFPPHGRIPNFKGSRNAAHRLFDIPLFARAKKIKINPDTAQAAVRAEALRRGITIFIATPGLAGGFFKLDPSKIDRDQIPAASKMAKCRTFAENVALKDLPQLDAIVCGTVAVTRAGHRVGKGAGYSDMEFAILAELGHQPVPVATTVHDIQVVEGLPQSSNDQGLSFIATPTQIIECDGPVAIPTRIEWENLSKQDLSEMPVLEDLRRLKGQ